MLSYVVAIGKNNELGNNGTLPWYLPEDLAYFKKVTTSNLNENVIIMGRKTFNALPFILPNRHHIVITRDKSFSVNDKNLSVVHDIDYIKKLQLEDKEYFVIGGAEIFKQLLPNTSKFYMTFVHKTFNADVHFPTIDWGNLTCIYKSDTMYDRNEDASFTYETYIR